MITKEIVAKQKVIHSEDVIDIISKPPSWLIRWGITSILAFVGILIIISANIKYPDVIRTKIKITSRYAPKPVLSKIQGKITHIFVSNNQIVNSGDVLAYLESTSNPNDVLTVLNLLRKTQQSLNTKEDIPESLFFKDKNYNLGELQPAYQAFIQNLLDYRSAIKSGFLTRKKTLLNQDLNLISNQQDELKQQKALQQKDLSMAVEELDMHNKLFSEKVETANEYRAAKSKFLAKESPINQTNSAILNARSSYAGKQKDILELENQISEVKEKFYQALNSLISQAEDWKSKYVLEAQENGRLSFSGNIEPNQNLTLGQEIFIIYADRGPFFGEMIVPQSNMGKVQVHQRVLIKLYSYPYEQYGLLQGTISNVGEVPLKDSVFYSDVALQPDQYNNKQTKMHLKPGMNGDAEIITENATILRRLARAVFKVVK